MVRLPVRNFRNESNQLLTDSSLKAKHGEQYEFQRQQLLRAVSRAVKQVRKANETSDFVRNAHRFNSNTRLRRKTSKRSLFATENRRSSSAAAAKSFYDTA